MKVCVVGAGIFGMASALELRQRGHQVTLIERGEIPNPEASSTDVSKVIRRTSYSNQTYVELVTRAAVQWREWHDRTSRSIYFQTGKLIVVRDFGPEHEALAGWETLSRLGIDLCELTAKQAGERFPQFAVSDQDRLFYDPWAGYLRSGQALADLARLARDSGVTIRENTLVTAVEETDSAPRSAGTRNPGTATAWWWRPAPGWPNCCRRWRPGCASRGSRWPSSPQRIRHPSSEIVFRCGRFCRRATSGTASPTCTRGS